VTGFYRLNDPTNSVKALKEAEHLVWFLCGSQVKLCEPLVTHGPCLSTLETKGL